MFASVDRLKSTYDVVIVGARCAGAATAMLLARAGVSVLLVEQGARGADTLSTFALMRGGVLQLSRWGLLDAIESAGTPRITTTTFHYGTESVAIRIKPRDGVDALFAPRRTLLDPLLADAAAAAGADVAYRVRLTDLQRDDSGRVTGVVIEGERRSRPIEASLVVGADGMHSTVASRVGAEPYRVGTYASGVIYTLIPSRSFEGYHWHYRAGASVGVIPTNGGETLVFAAAPRQRFLRELRLDLAAGFNRVVREVAPEIAESIGAAGLHSYRGFAGGRGFLRPAWGPGWALVGDAGYFKDPITAHGITDALRDAETLAWAILSGGDAALLKYQSIRDELSVPLFTITDEIASYAWDLTRLQVLHRSLSEEMAKEVTHIVDAVAGSAALR
ncbi:MAG TPA: NAD(P)/FAD-dependent oxidoreductase [Vicinamibacterales bacterium]|nr:NAD(P)/FAD-dependent oxidoreductase [Vicinamibacterales bacterium]